MTNPYIEAVTFSQSEVGDMVGALGGGFKYLIPIGLGLVALVAAAFWLLKKGRKFASSAN